MPLFKHSLRSIMPTLGSDAVNLKRVRDYFSSPVSLITEQGQFLYVRLRAIDEGGSVNRPQVRVYFNLDTERPSPLANDLSEIPRVELPDEIYLTPGQRFRLAVPMSFSLKGDLPFAAEVEAFRRFIGRAYRGPRMQRIKDTRIYDLRYPNRYAESWLIRVLDRIEQPSAWPLLNAASVNSWTAKYRHHPITSTARAKSAASRRRPCGRPSKSMRNRSAFQTLHDNLSELALISSNPSSVLIEGAHQSLASRVKELLTFLSLVFTQS